MLMLWDDPVMSSRVYVFTYTLSVLWTSFVLVVPELETITTTAVGLL